MDNPQVGLQNVDFSGGLGGVFASQQQMDADRQRALEMQGKDLANTYQGLQNTRYGQETPFSVQKSQGEANTASAAGEIAQGSKDQVLKQKVAEALAGKSKAEIEQSMTENDLHLQKLLAAKVRYADAVRSGQGPQAALAMAKEFGYDTSNPQVMQQLQGIISDPEKVNQVIDGYINASKQAGQATGRYIHEKYQTDKKSETDLATSRISAGAQIEAAKINAASREAVQGMKVPAIKEPTTAEASYLKNLSKEFADGKITHEELQAETAKLFDAKYVGKNGEGTNAAIIFDKNGKPQYGPKPTNPSLSESRTKSSEDTKMVDGVEYVKVPGGWKRK